MIAWSVAVANAVAVARWIIGAIVNAVADLSALLRTGWRIIRRNGMPVQIVHFVTARCNLRCEHCFYKESLDAPNPGEISLESLDRTVSDIGPVLWYSLAGGEPFLRKDLVDVISIIRNRCRPRVLSVPTNGWYVERTFHSTLRALQRITGGNLVVFLSLDGPEEVHDAIRGVGSFSKARACMERLRPLQEFFPNLYLNVITTVMPQNAEVAPAFIDEIVSDFRPNSISINLFRYHSLDHPPIPVEVLDAYDASMRIFAGHLHRGSLAHYGFFGRRILAAKEVLKGEVISRIGRENEYVTPCTAGSLSYVINEDGLVAACEILDKSQVLGSLTGTQRSGEPLRPPGEVSVAVSVGETDGGNRELDSAGSTFVELVRSDEARRLRTWIRETECRCTYECAMTTNTLFSWPLAGRLFGGVVGSMVGSGGRRSSDRSPGVKRQKNQPT
jgi:MoaA/NifB/PqqE/SkfB family radical SAM enzyme